ncbi:hypothetical protein JHK86_034145 [Glycine max]|nr:hypothetical protein JHK86_034145 [Glycine max]
MTFEVGAVLEDANWQAPVNCFDENDKEKNIPILGSAVRGGSLGSYDVGSATWADLRKAPLQSAMEVHFVLKELVRKSISETEVSNVSAMSQQCFQKRKIMASNLNMGDDKFKVVAQGAINPIIHFRIDNDKSYKRDMDHEIKDLKGRHVGQEKEEMKNLEQLRKNTNTIIGGFAEEGPPRHAKNISKLFVQSIWYPPTKCQRCCPFKDATYHIQRHGF